MNSLCTPARLPKPPVGLDDPCANDHVLNGITRHELQSQLQSQEMKLGKMLLDHESNLRKYIEDLQSVICKAIEVNVGSIHQPLRGAEQPSYPERPLSAVPVSSPASNGAVKGDQMRPGVSTSQLSGSATQHAESHFHRIQQMQRSHLGKKKQEQRDIKKAKSLKTGALSKLSEAHQLAEVKELEKRYCAKLYFFVRGPLDQIISILIATSTALTLVNWEWEGCKSNESLGIKSCEDWPDVDYDFMFNLFEQVFTATFGCELALRVAVEGKKFFYSKLHMLDSIIVIASTFDVYVLAHLDVNRGRGIAFARIVRYTRFIRSIRFVRQLAICRPLRILAGTIIHSLSSLAWSLLCLLMAQLLAALLLCQTLAPFVRDASADYDTRLWVNSMYGSSMKAFYTMFEVTLSGGWPQYVRPLVEKVSVWYSLFYLAYVIFVVFALIRIITALFLKDTLNAAAADAEMEIENSKAKRIQFEERLTELFSLADKTGNGTISFDEFTEIFDDPNVKTWCKLLDLQIKEVNDLFDMIDDGDGQIGYHEFIEGMSRLRGNATSQDVVSILHDCDKILNQCAAIHRDLLEFARGGLHDQ